MRRYRFARAYNSADLILESPITRNCSHKIDVVTFRGSPETWFRKEMKDLADARHELLAQELFRVLIPHQPKTRLAVNKNTNTVYVLSEAVDGYSDFRLSKNDTIRGIEGGLGQTLVVAIYLQEIDLKHQNIGIDSQNRVVKIDGGWSFAGIKDSTQFPENQCAITKSLLTQLPYPDGFQAFNWFSFITEGTNGKGTKKWRVEKKAVVSLAADLIFQNGVYQAIHKIIITPDIFLANMVDACIPAGGGRYLEFLISRRNTLKQEAIEIPGFIQYLRSDNATYTIHEHLDQLLRFAINENHEIIKSSEEGKLLYALARASNQLDRACGLDEKHPDGMQYGMACTIFRIHNALENYTPTMNIDLFGCYLSLGSKKNGVKQQALNLIERAGNLDESLYKDLYDLLFVPFYDEDIIKSMSGSNTAYLEVLRAFNVNLDEYDYKSYSQIIYDKEEDQMCSSSHFEIS